MVVMTSNLVLKYWVNKDSFWVRHKKCLLPCEQQKRHEEKHMLRLSRRSWICWCTTDSVPMDRYPITSHESSEHWPSDYVCVIAYILYTIPLSVFHFAIVPIRACDLRKCSQMILLTDQDVNKSSLCLSLTPSLSLPFCLISSARFSFSRSCFFIFSRLFQSSFLIQCRYKWAHILPLSWWRVSAELR